MHKSIKLEVHSKYTPVQKRFKRSRKTVQSCRRTFLGSNLQTRKLEKYILWHAECKTIERQARMSSRNNSFKT